RETFPKSFPHLYAAFPSRNSWSAEPARRWPSSARVQSPGRPQIVKVCIGKSCLVLQLAFVNHIRNLEPTVEFHFADLNTDAQFPTVGVDEGLTVEHPRKDKLRAHAVRRGRAILRQRNSLAVFSLQVRCGLERLTIGGGNLLHRRADPFPVGPV